MSDSDWLRRRAPLRHRDASLSDAALRWLAHLPAEVRPNALAARHARIVNRFAGLWRDPGLTEHYLDELTASRRPQRQGFVPEVVAELDALRVCNEQRLYEADDDPA